MDSLTRSRMEPIFAGYPIDWGDTKDFYTALKSVFREDVNVIMIGEMRGPETIATAVTAAETGHLVFSTLHTNNASQTIDRIIDSFPA